MKEFVVISGKGGTGKTSLVASFAALQKNAVLADCDVDASNLHLLLDPRVLSREEFRAGRVARIREAACTGCGECLALCRFGGVTQGNRAMDSGGRQSRPLPVPEGEGTLPDRFVIDATACEGCGVCAHFCPEAAIDLMEKVSGEWFSSMTRCGPMVHARLGTAAENSGKLVSRIRIEARRIAEETGRELIMVDGSPGIGCPVIASITGCDLVLAVTEPTRAGLHDLERVVRLAGHFHLPLTVAINKFDLNLSVTEKIERFCEKRSLAIAGKIPYDRAFTEAMIEGKSLVEYGDGSSSLAIRACWNALHPMLSKG